MNGDAMTCAALGSKMQSPLLGRQDETAVVVRLAEHGGGPTPAALVVGGYGGFDWDSGRFILETDRELVSWDYLERYIPDIREKVEERIHERNEAALKRIMEGHDE